MILNLSIQPFILSQIILVHGSFAKNATWYQPGGDFYETLRYQASKHHQRVTSVSWSGIPDYAHIKEAGQNLALYLLSITDTMPTILVGHSHGGNVINIASQVLYERYLDIVQTFSFDLVHNLVMSKPGSLDGFDLTATPMKFLMTMRKPKIDWVVLLGTPIDEVSYWPHMEVVEKLLLLYSYGDLVQTVAGSYARKYSEHERKVQLEVGFKNSELGLNFLPSHSQLHHCCIGQRLLLILNEEGYHSSRNTVTVINIEQGVVVNF